MTTPAPDQHLQRLIASLVVVRASGHLADHQRRYPQWELANGELQELLALGVGGVILLGGSAAELALRTRQLQGWACQPLLLCADVEEGVGQRFEGASWLVPPLALGRLHSREPERALALAERYGRCCGLDSRAVGLNWVLGPVCDVNNNPANPVINVRAWGEDPASAGALAAAFLRGLQATGVLGCAKHFPGHGDTTSDSHLELPLLPHSRQRLEQVELPPFRQAIAAGVEAVMTGHLTLPALDPERPATLSRAVLHQLLREQLGFEGLVVTDALVMEAIAGQYGAGEAAVLALEAGADLVLMPADARLAIEAITAAVDTGRLPLAQLEASAARRQRALGRCAAAPPDPERAASADLDLCRELVSATLEHQGGRLGLRGDKGVNLLRLDQALLAPFLPATAPALGLPEAAGFQPRLMAAETPILWSSDPLAPLQLDRLGTGPVLVQLFVRGNPFRGTAGDGEPWAAALGQLQRAGRLAGLAVFGSPYLWDSLRRKLPPQTPAAYCPGQMPLAQQAVLGALGLGRSAEANAVPTEFTD
ncbi:MAG: glycoside hydrolase family 3 N-terminal domain-containing protein [Cyanobium sp.]